MNEPNIVAKFAPTELPTTRIHLIYCTVLTALVLILLLDKVFSRSFYTSQSTFKWRISEKQLSSLKGLSY